MRIQGNAAMEAKEIVLVISLIILIVCAVSVNLTKNLLSAVIIYLSYSSVMCIVWVLIESPDLAITEAAVGAGVSGIMLLLTLKKVKEENERISDEIEDRRTTREILESKKAEDESLGGEA